MARFGERVRGAPKNRGFGRLAWLGPIVILFVGLAMIARYLRRYRAAPAALDAPGNLDARVRERIEDELKTRRT